MKTGIELIADERARQISEEGWTAEHDKNHTCGEIPAAAACYALNASGFLAPLEMKQWHKGFTPGVKVKLWPWSINWWKPTTPIRDLVKAGALIAAEIDRLQKEAAQDA